MEAQFTIRDTLLTFADWLTAYGAANVPGYVPHGIGRNPDGDGWLLEHGSPVGEVLFYVLTVEPELLEVRAVTRWRLDLDTGQWLTENDELNAYFAVLVRAIRWKWTDEPGLNELERFYLQAVRERPKERGKLEDYCHKKGLTDQTLRNWNRKFQAMGIDTGWTD